MKAIHSLVLAQDFPPVPGGVSVYTENLYKNWSGRAVIIAPDLHEPVREQFPANILVKRVPMDVTRGSLKAYLARQITLYRAGLSVIKKEKVHVVHCSHMASGLAALMINKLHSVPYILYTYGSEITGQPGIVRHTLAKSILNNALRVITISQFTKRAIVRYGIDSEKIRLLVGVEVNRFSRVGNPEATRKKYSIAGSPVILTVARLTEHKGIDTVIKALPNMLTRYPDMLYLVVGEGPYRSTLEGMSRELGVEKHVRLLGNIPHELQDETEAFYSLCDLFLMISRNINDIEAEGFGLVFLEAGLSRKAVIGGNSGGIGDAVIDGVTGMLVEPGDPGQISECVLSLLENPNVMKRMGENGYKRAVSSFDWRINAGKWEKELAALLTG